MSERAAVLGRGRRVALSRTDPVFGIIRSIGGLLERRGASGYVGGGLLRDLVLGVRARDLDIAVRGVSPQTVARHLHRHLHFSRPVIFPRFGTVLTVGGEVEIEICKLEGDIKTDAERRDFTVNCLYASIGDHSGTRQLGCIEDPTGKGMADIETGYLRCPADPVRTVWLDPLRMLRGIRFSTTLGFALDPGFIAAAQRMAFLLGRVAPERIRSELEIILLSPRLPSALRLMRRAGVLAQVLPELDRTHGFCQSTPYHDYDLFTHSVKTAAGTPPDIVLRLAALLHDIGKVDTRRDLADRSVYYGHEKVSARMAAGAVARLKFSRRVAEDVVFIVRSHMINYSYSWTDRAVRRFMKKTGRHLEALLTLARADRKAQRGEADGLIETLSSRVEDLARQDRVRPGLPVTGRDIMAILGIDQGPTVGKAKAYLLEQAARAEGPMSRDEAVRILRRWAERRL